MATANQVINAAKAEIRTAAYVRPNKFTEWYAAKYGAAYKTASWCGMFVKYIIEKACGDTELLKGCTNVAYVPTIYNWAKEKGYIRYSGKKGDLIIFDWECNNGRLDRDHVGFFVKDNGNGTITTIEGNTSNTSNGNGNCVQQRVRDKKWVGCYIRLPYKETKTTTKTTKEKYTGSLPTGTISVETGTKADIKLWQKFLNWYEGWDLKVDGIFGTMSYKATKDFQSANGLTADGIVGKQTIEKARTIEK